MLLKLGECSEWGVYGWALEGSWSSAVSGALIGPIWMGFGRKPCGKWSEMC